jgi:hypothetical protein
MNDQTPAGEPQSNPGEQPNYTDRREQRRREREMRRQARWSRRGGGWFGGAVLILLGLIFLFENFGIFPITNWWALFILIPAFGAFAAAWNGYQDSGGRLTAGVRGSLFGGFILVLITAIFLFDLGSLVWLWPALLILAGVGLLVNAMVK